ncbi:MAG: hypothetical protein ABIH41_01295, partial [Nanoarchaeota archaeon]
DIEEMKESVDALIELVERPKAEEYRDLFWVIKGRAPLIARFAAENQTVEREILSCSELDKMLYKNMRIIKGRVAEGVKVKFITPFDKKNAAVYRAWIDAGVQIRVFDTVKFGLLPRIAIFDGKKGRLTVGIPEVRNEEDYITLWTESKAFSVMLRNQFMHMWRSAKPIQKYLD